MKSKNVIGAQTIRFYGLDGHGCDLNKDLVGYDDVGRMTSKTDQGGRWPTLSVSILTAKYKTKSRTAVSR